MSLIVTYYPNLYRYSPNFNSALLYDLRLPRSETSQDQKSVHRGNSRDREYSPTAVSYPSFHIQSGQHVASTGDPRFDLGPVEVEISNHLQALEHVAFCLDASCFSVSRWRGYIAGSFGSCFGTHDSTPQVLIGCVLTCTNPDRPSAD